jgi:hypothetical protein
MMAQAARGARLILLSGGPRSTARRFAGRTPEQQGYEAISDPNTKPNVRPTAKPNGGLGRAPETVADEGRRRVDKRCSRVGDRVDGE